MKPVSTKSCVHLAIFSGFLVLGAGYASAQQPATPSTKPAPATTPMEGCGMMVNGKMVYKDTHGAPCMTMNKPAGMMPNGVTMHSEAWFKKCHFRVTPEIDRALIVKVFLVLGVTLI
jgi:hypothetical protein